MLWIYFISVLLMALGIHVLEVVPSYLHRRHFWHSQANFWSKGGKVSLILMQLCSASWVPGVPGESGGRLSGSEASVINAEPGSLIPGLITARCKASAVPVFPSHLVHLCLGPQGHSSPLPSSLFIYILPPSLWRGAWNIKEPSLLADLLGLYLYSFHLLKRHAVS